MPDSLPEPPDLDPASLAGGSFTRARRGFEPVEVNKALGRASDALRTWQLRDRSLVHRVAELEGELVEARKLDEGRIASVLGEETARVISAAREAAAEIRSKAEDEAARMIREAEESSTASANALRAEAEALRAESEALREEATKEYASKLDEAQRLSDELIASAQSRHDELVTTAQARHDELVASGKERHDRLVSEAQQRHDDLIEQVTALVAERTTEAEEAAEAVREGARIEGREMLAEAKAVRDRVLADLAERRRTARRQIEGAIVGRDRIVELIRQAGVGLVDVVSELEGADDVARDSANHAASLLPDDSEQFLAELDLGDVDLTVLDLGSGSPAGVEAAGTDALPDGDGDSPADAGETPSIAFPEQVDRPEQADVPESLGVTEQADDTESGDPAGSTDEPAPTAQGEPMGAVGAETGDSDGTSTPPGHGVTRGIGTDDGDGDIDDGADDFAAPAVDSAVVQQSGATVHDLFARIRAQGLDDGDEGIEDTHTIGASDDDDDDDDDMDDDDIDDDRELGAAVIDLSGPVVVAEGGDDNLRGVSGDEPDDELAKLAELLDGRDELLAPVERQMLRSLRRLASDEQNEVLDRLRRHKRGIPGVDEVISSPEAMLGAFGDGVIDDFTGSVRAGFDFWGQVGGNLTTTVFKAGDEVRARLDAILTGFISVHRAHLERTMAHADEAGSDIDDLTQSVKAVYRDWRQGSLAEIASDLAIAGFSYGERLAAGPGTPWVWVVDNGGLPCADGEDNALAGVVLSDESFPTGDLAPPAHAGCRCILVPAPN